MLAVFGVMGKLNDWAPFFAPSAKMVTFKQLTVITRGLSGILPRFITSLMFMGDRLFSLWFSSPVLGTLLPTIFAFY